jgi:signal transduction histidine kinase
LLGTLTVANRKPTQFTERQADLLAAFANWAAVAVETSELYDRVKSVALLEERERIGMDLHDGVIQSIYAVSLGLEDALERLEESPQNVRQRLDKAIDDLNKVTRDIRSYIFDLRPQVSDVSDLRRALGELVDELKVNTLMEADLHAEGELPLLDEEQAKGLVHIAQEALHNVAKHSRATSAQVRVAASGRVLTMEVIDNGVGFDFDLEAQRDMAKQGLRNMTDRARVLGARLSIDSAAGKGTRVSLELPLEETTEK